MTHHKEILLKIEIGVALLAVKEGRQIFSVSFSSAKGDGFVLQAYLTRRRR